MQLAETAASSRELHLSNYNKTNRSRQTRADELQNLSVRTKGNAHVTTTHTHTSIRIHRVTPNLKAAIRGVCLRNEMVNDVGYERPLRVRVGK